MQKITATGPRAAVEAAWNALAWADPSPAQAVDSTEESRSAWRLVAYALDDDDANACLAIIHEAAPGLNPQAAPLPDLDWVKLSLEGLPAVAAGRFVIAGQHAAQALGPGRTNLLVEAGPAFGTGHHGTTLGCLLALDTLLRHKRPGRVLDLGTGTGVLAIAALKAGACLAVASDIDADSIITADENARTNHVARRMKSVLARGANHARIRRHAPYDTIFANILARPLVSLAPDIAQLAAPGATIILSGLLAHQEPLVRRAFAGRGLIAGARIRKDGWSTLVFRRKAVSPIAPPGASGGPYAVEGYAGARHLRARHRLAKVSAGRA